MQFYQVALFRYTLLALVIWAVHTAISVPKSPAPPKVDPRVREIRMRYARRQVDACSAFAHRRIDIRQWFGISDVLDAQEANELRLIGH